MLKLLEPIYKLRLISGCVQILCNYITLKNVSHDKFHTGSCFMKTFLTLTSNSLPAPPLLLLKSPEYHSHDEKNILIHILKLDYQKYYILPKAILVHMNILISE